MLGRYEESGERGSVEQVECPGWAIGGPRRSIRRGFPKVQGLFQKDAVLGVPEYRGLGFDPQVERSIRMLRLEITSSEEQQSLNLDESDVVLPCLP